MAIKEGMGDTEGTSISGVERLDALLRNPGASITSDDIFSLQRLLTTREVAHKLYEYVLTNLRRIYEPGSNKGFTDVLVNNTKTVLHFLAYASQSESKDWGFTLSDIRKIRELSGLLEVAHPASDPLVNITDPRHSLYSESLSGDTEAAGRHNAYRLAAALLRRNMQKLLGFQEPPQSEHTWNRVTESALNDLGLVRKG